MARQKIVLITGASGAVGAATARLLAGAGHHVVLGARGIARLALLAADIRAAGGSVEYAALDVTDADDAQSFVLAAHRRHGRVDVLVNAAGHAPLARLDTLKLKEWDRMIDVNLRGTLNTMAAVLPLMRIAGAGHVVNLAGGAAGPAAGVLAATQAAVRALSESLRQEEQHLRVTVVAPVSASCAARSVACAIGQPDYLAAARRAGRMIRRLTWAGDGPGTSATQRRSPPPASPR